MVEHTSTLVPTGNMVGKTFLDAGVILWFLATHPNCLVVATAPTQVQLEEVLWKDVERAYLGARIPLGGRLLRSPLKIDFGGGWQALAYSTTKVERFSGHHAADLLVVVDEASGVADEIYEAISSLNPSRELLTGNPLRPSGTFYDRCYTAANTVGTPDRLSNVIQVSSLDSPHIGLDRSPWGLADRTWLEKARIDYGEGSLWWICHVLGRFPDSGEDSVIPMSWLNLTSDAPAQPGGRPRIAIDLGEGKGGDLSAIIVRDDNRVIDLWHDNMASFSTTASLASRWSQRYNVKHEDISFDASGIGADFGNRLQQVGIVSAQAYRGSNAGGPRFHNLRSSAAWALRQRLDPERKAIRYGTDPAKLQSELVGHRLKVVLDQRGNIRRPGEDPQAAHGTDIPQFSIPSRILNGHLREELIGLRYSLDLNGRIQLEPKEDFAERLKRSPDLCDALCQSFAYR